MFPPVNTTLRDVKQFTDIFRSISIQDKPEGTLLQVLANVTENHGELEFAEWTPFFFLFFSKVVHVKAY